MQILEFARSRLKALLRLPVRQTEAYVRSLRDGSFFDRLEAGGPQALRATGGGDRRGRILVLDYALPTPDRDAGSRTTFEHVVSLVDLGYDLAFWPFDGLDVPRYTHPLRRIGIEVVVGYFRPSLRSWLAARPGRFDFILLNRPQVATVHIDTLRASGTPIVYYGHDLHCTRMAMEARGSGDPDMGRQAQEMEQQERKIWRRVCVSTYPAPEEIVRVAELEPDVVARHLPAFCFDTFQPRIGAPTGVQIMFVGSFRHPPNEAAAQWLARDILPRVRQRVPLARLVIAGAYVTGAVETLADDAVEVVGWLSGTDLAALYSASRVAVVPLLVGAGVKLKVVEALHNGVPLVTTTVGAQGLEGLERIVPIHDEASALAEAVVSALLSDDLAWLDQSHRQLGYVRDHFSRDAMKRSLVEALELAAVTTPVE